MDCPISLASDDTCTGCGACKNICPENAIQMKMNEETFIVPSIDTVLCVSCHRCEIVCPVLNFRQDNDKKICYALQADDVTRMGSSSGGAFPLLANHILSLNGIVIGAAFDKEMQLRHIAVSRKQELEQLKGSKYLQSDVKLIYRETLKYLEQGKHVLFTGTPCQVAGLNNFLGKKYERLITVDLVCHGVPSQYLFDIYLTEMFSDKKVIDARFRDKRYGWVCYKIIIEFDDKTFYEGAMEDPYQAGFHPNLFLRKVCADCKFSTFPRQGDISVGDFWGYEKIDPEHRDDKGTSLIFLNSPIGEQIFDRIAPSTKLINEIDLARHKFNNRTGAIYPAHKHRLRFFGLLKTHSFSKSVELSLKETYDIGLYGIYRCPNFGSTLTYYALFCTLEDLGYATLMIERPNNAKDRAFPLANSFEKSPYPDYALAPLFETKGHMTQLCKKARTFMVGSDQLFHHNLYREMGHAVTLDWVSDNKRKIAYAASFGRDQFMGSEEDRAQMAFFMQKFAAFSTREISGVKILKDEFGVDAEWVLDPVFLCDTKHFNDLANAGMSSQEGRYISSYILDPSKEKELIINEVSKKLGMAFEIYSDMYFQNQSRTFLWDLAVETGKVETRLSSIANSHFIITDSFHGVCFAIIFRKNFIAIRNYGRGATRFMSVLSKLGLLDRLVDNYSGIKERKLLSKDIDYKAVEELLEKYKRESFVWLKKNLAPSPKKPYSQNDIVRALSDRLYKAENQNDRLKDTLKTILSNIGLTLCSENDINKYFEKLKLYCENYIVVITTKDTPGKYFTEEHYRHFYDLGCNISLVNKHWHSYICAINDGKNRFEKLSGYKQNLDYSTTIGNISLHIQSQTYETGDLAKIIINGKSCAMNMRGINIVVYDKVNKGVVDSVAFDTHELKYPCKHFI